MLDERFVLCVDCGNCSLPASIFQVDGGYVCHPCYRKRKGLAPLTDAPRSLFGIPIIDSPDIDVRYFGPIVFGSMPSPFQYVSANPTREPPSANGTRPDWPDEI